MQKYDSRQKGLVGAGVGSNLSGFATFFWTETTNKKLLLAHSAYIRLHKVEKILLYLK